VEGALKVLGNTSSVGRDTANGGGCDSGLAGQSDIAESGHRQADSAAVYGPAGVVKGTGGGKVVDIGPVPGGQDY
jgi:hypothetical protein